MNFKQLTLLTMILQVYIVAKSQDTTQVPAAADTIKYVSRTDKFYLNGKKLPFADMKPMLLKYNSSAIEFKKYQRRATPGTIILLAGLTSGVVALAKQNKDTPFFTPLSTTLFAANLVGIPLMISAKKHLKRSAKFHNRELLNAL